MSQNPSNPAPARTTGEILTQHQLKPIIARRVQYMLILSMVVMLAALLWSVYRWYFAFARFGPAVVWRWSGPAIGIAFLALLLASYSTLFLMRNRQRKVYTTSEGLWLVNGGNQLALRWEDIASIHSSAARFAWSRSDRGPQLRIVIRTSDDKIIKLPSFLTELDVVQEIIKKNIYPIAMNRYREMMKSGQPLQFGPLQLTRSGIVYKDRVEPWQSFRDVAIESGRLKIQFQRPKGLRQIAVPVRQIPNIDLCVQLLRNIEY